ncbi:MAG: redoxin family protein [Phycisphaerae bacterium]|nr:redoxin family protein [Phycisphaerae bacterium]
MRSRFALLAFALTGLVTTTSTFALDLGSPAPALQISEWAKGNAQSLRAGKGKNVFVVEFWATWCGPCKMSIPHLTEMQAKYKDKGLVVIGITDEQPGVVKEFLQKMGDKMQYTVAIDKAHATTKAYMGGFGARGIPFACVVDKAGLIIWNGNPLDGLDEVIDQVMEGKYDLEAAKQGRKAEKRADVYFSLIPRADAAKTADGKAKMLKDARRIGDEVVTLAAKSPNVLNSFAWTILTDEKFKNRDVELALKAAQKAVELTENKNPNILDTYARALWDSNRKEEALKIQRQAVELEKTPAGKAALKKTLQTYERELKSAETPAAKPAK